MVRIDPVIDVAWFWSFPSDRTYTDLLCLYLSVFKKSKKTKNPGEPTTLQQDSWAIDIHWQGGHFQTQSSFESPAHWCDTLIALLHTNSNHFHNLLIKGLLYRNYGGPLYPAIPIRIASRDAMKAWVLRCLENAWRIRKNRGKVPTDKTIQKYTNLRFEHVWTHLSIISLSLLII